MKRLNLKSHELKALYPPMSEGFEKMVSQTLYTLENRKENIVVKKKLSLGLILAILLILASISAAIALTQSDLLKYVFGSGQTVPQEFEDVVKQPEETIQTPYVTISLHEYLFDGEKLHLQWTLSSNTDKQVMVTMNGFFAGEMWLSNWESPAILSVKHDCGQLLGGDVEGIPVPGSIDYYSAFMGIFDGEAERPFIKGETLDLSAKIFIWEVENPPIGVNLGNMTDKDFSKEIKRGRLHADRTGFCELAKFVDESQMTDFSAADYQRMYEKLGWVKLIAEQPVHFQITLDDGNIQQLAPVQTSFDMDDFSLIVDRFSYSRTGGTVELRVYPKQRDAKLNMDPLNGQTSALCRRLAILDADSKDDLGNGSSYGIDTDENGDEYVHYQLDLAPITGSMPSAILIVPSEYIPKWDPEADDYDPNGEHNPVNGTPYEYAMEEAVRVDLQ